MIFKNKRLAFESSCYNRVQYNNITYIIYKARNILRVLYILLHHLHNYLYIPVPNLHLNYICHIRFCILYFMLGFMLEDMTCTFFMYHIIYYIYIYIYIRSICRQQLFPSLRAHQYSSDQMKILKDQSAQTTARVVSVVYRLKQRILRYVTLLS